MSCGSEGMSCGSTAWAAKTAGGIDFSDRENVLVYVRSYPGPGEKWPISTSGGSEPVWSRDGRELFYRSGRQMFAVAISAETSFQAGRPELLFEEDYDAGSFVANYDVSPDGRRFLMIQSEERPASREFYVVLNWLEEVKGHVGDAR